MIDPKLLDILVCPETKTPLKLADESLVGKVNERIRSGSLINREGQPVNTEIQAGLVAEKNPDRLYPVRDDIPVLLVEESIPLETIL